TTNGALAWDTAGSITYTTTAEFHGAASSTYEAKEAAGALSNGETAPITVNAVNDLPTITDIVNQTVNEDTATAALPFTIGDVETAATALTVTTSSSNLTLVPAANIVLSAAGDTCTVTVTPPAIRSATATISVTVTDAHGGTASDSFQLPVFPTRRPPDLTDIVNQTVNEDTATAALAFTIGDVETAATALTVTTSSSNLTLVPAANIVL